MTKFGKCLVIFAVGASFAFLGFAWVSRMGGPNWHEEAAQLPDYAIQKESDKWTVRDRVSGEAVTVKAPTVHAAAVIAAREAQQKKQENEIKSLKDETAAYKNGSTKIRELNQVDAKALEARVHELELQLASLLNKITNLSKEQVSKSQDAQAIQLETTKRREDVFRLTRELQEIRTDQFRADELKKKLSGQLVRLQGVISALESRNEQLRGQIHDVAR